MKLQIIAIIPLLLAPLNAEVKRQERKSLLDSDPSVVYLEKILGKPLELKVIKEAPVFSDKSGNHRLGTLKIGQMIKVEAITERNYRVRGQGTRDGIAGWVAPWAFSSADPNFVANLKSFYERQMQVNELIAKKAVAIGMTLDEVTLSRGQPTKTNVRKTATGESGRWEFIDYEEVKNYVTEIDRLTGQAYRRLVSVTQQEKSKTVVEFENNAVTAIEESADSQGGNVRIIVPPLIFHW